MAGRTRAFRISSIEQLEVLALPVRTEIVECVSFLGPCSVGDLSRILGRKRPALHFHVARLVDVGLLLPSGERGAGRQRETLYRTPGSPVFVKYDPGDTHKLELIVRYGRNMLSRAQRLLERALRSGKARTAKPHRDTYVAEMTTWLSNQELAEVNGLIEELHRRFRPRPRAQGTKLCSLAVTLTPLFPGDDQ